VTFANETQRAVYGRVRSYIEDLFGELAVYREDAPAFAIAAGSAVAHVHVLPWTDQGAIVTTRAFVVSGVTLTEDLMRWMLERNAEALWGAFGVDEDGEIVIDHSINGPTCDKEDLRASVLGVIFSADRYDDEIVARWGGERALDRKD
jgi:hypothetical protein